MEFKEYFLGELCEIKSSKRIYAKDYVNKGVPFYRSKEIIEKSNGLDISQKLYIDNKKFEEIEEKHGVPETGDLLLTSVGTLGVPYIVKNEKFYFKDGNLTWFTNFKPLLNQYYLFYWFKSKEGIGEINRVTIGSTQKALTIKNLRYLKITLPDKKNQFKITNLIQKIESKLENNKQIIANLEELSQTLFKRWFVDFEFPDENGNPYKSSGGEMIDSELGNIPRDWEVNELGNYVDIIKGLSYKGAFLDKQHERSDSFPLLSISNFNFISGFKSNKTKYYFGDYKERHLVNPGDILIAATDLTQDRKILGAPAIIPNLNKTMIFSLDVFKITETTIPKYVLYFLLQSAKYREFVEGSATGTTVIRIAKNVILKVPIVIDKDISLKFDDLIKPYMEKIEHLSQENQKLTQLRDTLLPKLMSGEIEIPDDIEVNEDELSI